ncbi:Hypothetical predicted protein [Mytilus galloprovincialis]|uniref:C2H2-type domain-containing protein n=1 Tax=Mytilus galloprovincialis TaxID=29158 RepID=A0A8B6H2Z8_MYTGA|nr:Hypothetical predicted protein [Mytilus galloprovincialis]
MADTGSGMNGVVLVGPGDLNNQENMISSNENIIQNDEVNGDDLLQLALDEASGGLSTNTIAYSVSNELVDAVANDTFQGTITGGDNSELAFENATYIVSGGDSVDFNAEGTQFQLETSEPGNNDSGNISVSVASGSDNHTSSVIGTTSSGLTVTLVPANEGSGAPLGSSQNPIRIIQQGNQYTPVQQLTTEQLQQIMQVVQQQQVAKSASEGGGSSVLYNPQTNTKIVYRVIYPSELHKTATGSQNSQGQQTIIQLNQQQKRQYKKRIKEEEERVDGPDLTREEKEARKKHRPRTRSGRVSKPPKHMMKDYKHIHVVDWDEDYDDSDGGYSDFKYSEDEKEEEKESEADFMFDTGQMKPKNWKCSTCHKSYIGRGGLGRHYRLNPSHGNVDDLPQEESDSSNLSRPTANGIAYTGSISEDSNTQDSIPGATLWYPTPGRPRKKGQRGRPPMYEQTPARKRHKLREFIKQYDTEDLMDIVLPRLAKVVTLWEFLMMKVESTNTNKPNIQSVYQEFELLTEKVKDLFKTCLKLSDSKSDESSDNRMKMSNSRLTEAIGFETGTYEVNTAVLQSTFMDNDLNNTEKIEIVKQFDHVRHKRPHKIEVMMGPSTESPTKRFKSILPNDKKSNVVVSTQGNIVLMGTPQTTNSTSPKIVLVNNAQTSQTSSNPLIVMNKNQSNCSAAVLECVQSSPSNVISSHTSTLPSASKQSHYVSNQVSPTKSVVLNSKSLPQKRSSQTLPSKPSTVVQSNISSGITIVPVNNSTGFNSVGKISSVYNTSLLSHNQVPKQTEIISNSVATSLLSSVVSKAGVMIAENNINNIRETDMESESLEMKPEVTQSNEGSTFIITNYNNVEPNNSLEPTTLGNSNVALENTMINSSGGLENPESGEQTIGETLIETNHMESTEMIELVNDQLITEDASLNNVITASNIYQTPEGIIIIQNQDGSTVQLQGSDGEPIPLETVQALLEGQYLQTTEGSVLLNQ